MDLEHPKKYNSQELDNSFLWKYLDIFKLISLISTKEIHFTRFDKLDDGLEGLTYEAIKLMLRTQNPPSTRDSLKHLGTDDNNINFIIQEEQEIRKKLEYEIYCSQKTQFVSCWFLNNKESLAMWNIYSEKNGVALKFKAKPLVETIIASAKSYTNSDFEKMYYGKVDYKNLWPYDETCDGKFNGLKKDNSYNHENEFRFVTVVKGKHAGIHSNFKLPISDIKNFDLEIISNPYIKDWQYKSLEHLLSKFGLENKLRPSDMKVNY